MINTVIFDIGNVLVKFDWKPYIYSTFEKATADRLADVIWKSGYWEQFDLGVLSDDEVMKLIEDAAPEYKNEIHTAIANAGEYLEQFSYANTWVQQLKASGYRVLFLSNYSQFLMDLKPEVLDFIPQMDGGIFSCHVKLMKPDLRIYERLFEQYGLNPQECLFIDDNRANIDAADKLGVHTVWFRGYEKSYEEVMELLRNH